MPAAASCRAVPGDSTGTGTFAFQVGPEFDLGSAVLTVGDAAAVQSVVAFGYDPADVTNEPVDLGLATLRGRAGSVRVRSPMAWCARTTRSPTVSWNRAMPSST